MRASLLQEGASLEERDFFEDRFTEEELRRLIGDRAVADFFSWNSPSFKKLGLSRDDLTGDDLIRLMAEEPRLVRRPLVQIGDELIVGTDKKAMERVFS